MPVDARIALGVEPVKMPDFAQLAVQRSAVMNNMAEMASKQRALNEQNTLAQLMQDPNFSFDNPESRSRVQRAAPNLGGTVLKSYDDAQAAQAEAKTKALAYADAQTLSMMTELFQYKDFGPAETMIDQRVDSGLLTPEQGAAAKAHMRSFATYPEFAFNQAQSQLTPAQRLEQTTQNVDLGGTVLQQAFPKYGGQAPTGTLTKTPTPDQLLDNQRAAAAERGPQVVTSTNAAGDFIIMDKNILNDPRMNPTGASSIVIPGAGKPSGGFEKAQAARGEYMKNYTAAMDVADELLATDSDLERARGGGLTTVGNAFMGLFDQSTPSAEAQGALDVAADTLLKQIQRFEGPQSDKDVISYEKAAASLRNTMTPMPVKKAALKVLRDALVRQKAYYDANPQAGASATGAGGGAGGVPKEIQDILNMYPKR